MVHYDLCHKIRALLQQSLNNATSLLLSSTISKTLYHKLRSKQAEADMMVKQLYFLVRTNSLLSRTKPAKRTEAGRTAE